jgi:hypothetical protein
VSHRHYSAAAAWFGLQPVHARLGVGGVCIHCDELLLLAELLDDQSATPLD